MAATNAGPMRSAMPPVDSGLRYFEPAPAGWTPPQGGAHQHRERRMETRKRRRFTAEYESEAVKRLAESGKTLQAVAQELGLHANQLRGRRNEHLAAGSAEALARQKAELARLGPPRRGGGGAR